MAEFYLIWHLHGTNGSFKNAASAFEGTANDLPDHINSSEKELLDSEVKQWHKKGAKKQETVKGVILHQVNHAV